MSEVYIEMDMGHKFRQVWGNRSFEKFYNDDFLRVVDEDGDGFDWIVQQRTAKGADWEAVAVISKFIPTTRWMNSKTGSIRGLTVTGMVVIPT